MKNQNSVLDNLELIKSSDKNIILLRPRDSGKTTLLNELCCKNFPKENTSNYSIKDAQFAKSLKGNNLIMDFTGLDVLIDFEKLFELQEKVFNLIPVRLICFVIEYSNRHDNINGQYKQMFSLFKNYNSNIFTIITKTEDLTLRNQKILEHNLEQFKIKKYMFAKLNMNSFELIEKIKNQIEKTKNIEGGIHIKEEIYKQFNNSDRRINPIDEKIFDKANELLDKFKKEKKIFIEKLKQIIDIDSKRGLFFSLRDYGEKLCLTLKEEIIKIIKEENDDDYLDPVFTIELELYLFKEQTSKELKEFKYFIEKEGIKVEPTIFDENKNFFRRCMYCGQVWMFYGECDNVTCGRKITQEEIE